MKNIRIILLLAASWYIFDACSTNPYKSGAVLYTSFCASCHGDDGQGFRDIYPPIANSDYLQAHAGDLTCIIRNGMWDTIIVNGKTYTEPMPEMPQLDAVAINNLNNYINYAWPYKEGKSTIIDIRAELAECE